MHRVSNVSSHLMTQEVVTIHSEADVRICGEVIHPIKRKLTKADLG